MKDAIILREGWWLMHSWSGIIKKTPKCKTLKHLFIYMQNKLLSWSLLVNKLSRNTFKCLRSVGTQLSLWWKSVNTALKKEIKTPEHLDHPDVNISSSPCIFVTPLKRAPSCGGFVVCWYIILLLSVTSMAQEGLLSPGGELIFYPSIGGEGSQLGYEYTLIEVVWMTTTL